MNPSVIRSLWSSLYPGETAERDRLVAHLEVIRARFPASRAHAFPTTGLVYCTYADAFGGGLDGVRAQLPRLQDLGVTVLWLLPLLESPGRDQGFDISSYTHVDRRFGGNEALARLLAEARTRGIAVVFDIAVNHTSDRHPWFLSALSPTSPYRSYYHWSDTSREYAEAPLIFPGMVESNWTWREEARAWNFHRFYPFQPDLNYKNPRVAFEMARTLADWKDFGIDGFRMDAAALLWKEEGTDCDSRPQVHLILKLFQACLDFVAPGSLLLAEANVAPEPLLTYFGEGDECKAAYHFELMPRFYQALLDGDPRPLAQATFPALPDGCAWFTFLRLHDEVTLDLVPPAARGALTKAYTKGDAAFRNGQAFSGRLFDLLDRSPEKTLAAWSLLFSLPGTPILYYGDEIAMSNNPAYFEAKAAETGFRDSRFLHRGPWDTAREILSAADANSPEGRVRRGLQAMLTHRRDHPALAASRPELTVEGSVLTSVRRHEGQSLTIVTDLKAMTTAWTLA